MGCLHCFLHGGRIRRERDRPRRGSDIGSIRFSASGSRCSRQRFRRRWCRRSLDRLDGLCLDLKNRGTVRARMGRGFYNFDNAIEQLALGLGNCFRISEDGVGGGRREKSSEEETAHDEAMWSLYRAGKYLEMYWNLQVKYLQGCLIYKCTCALVLVSGRHIHSRSSGKAKASRMI